jgi:hypothetical protein
LIKKAEAIPAPDLYNPNFELGKKKESSFSVGKSKRLPLGS